MNRQAGKNIDKAAEKMVAKRRWKNDFLEFDLGTKVLLRTDIDTNPKTRARPLNDNINHRIYVIDAIHSHDLVDIVSDYEDKIKHTNVSTIRLRKFYEQE